MDSTTNSLNWFEICATDIARAKKFYESIFSITMEDWNLPGMQMAAVPVALLSIDPCLSCTER